MEAKPYLPLSSYRDPHSFKVFVNDVGLLSAMSGLEAETLLKGSDIFVEFKGALTEQFVFQQLLQNKALYYWSKDNSRQEVDFIIQSDNQVVPIECKAEENLKAKSLASFIKEHGVSKAYKISMKPYQKSDDIVINVPLYMAAEIWFGLLVHDGKKSWKGLEINSFFGKPENLEIELEGGVDEGITEAQQKAYGNVRNNMDFMSIFESKCERMIFRIQHFAFRIEFVIFAK